MSIVVAGGNVVLGVAYLTLALLAVAEIARGRRFRGVSWFGLAYVAMALSCGPHHLVSGIQAIHGGDYTWMATAAAALALPAGGTFVWLRLEAAAGGRGDRLVQGTPWWLLFVALGFFLVAGALGAAAVDYAVEHGVSWTALAPNVFVTITYAAVGVLLLRTQVVRRYGTGGWSMSGLSLGAIFPTCALMHFVYGLSGNGGAAIEPADWLGIPASIYFLWVVYRLYNQAMIDWNRRPVVGVRRDTERPGPWTVRLLALANPEDELGEMT